MAVRKLMFIYESATEPAASTNPHSGTYLWRDTSGSTAVLKMRNKTNTAWVSVETALAGDIEVALDAHGIEVVDGVLTIVPVTVDKDLELSGNGTGNVNLKGGWEIEGTEVTASAAELNILAGVTADATEINILDGVTASTAELNILDGVTADATEINVLDGLTASTAELNTLDGVTATADQINKTCGYAVGSGLQQIILSGAQAITADAREVTLSEGTNGIAATIADAALMAGRPILFKQIGASTVDHTITLTAGTWDGTNDVATFQDDEDAILVWFDYFGNGTILANVGTVTFS